MRRSFIPLAVAALLFACADSPTAPQMQPGEASFGLTGSYPPPPWAEITGEISTDGGGALGFSAPLMSRTGPSGPSFSHLSNTATFVGWLLVTPGDHQAILRFADGGTATFSNGAAIMKVNDRVSGRGTMTVGGHTYALSAVTEFQANGGCATTPGAGPSCASFSAGDGSFSSAGSVWTGVLSNSGGWNFDGPPGGGGGGGGDACIDPFCFDGPGGGGGEFCLSLLCTDTPGLIRGKKP